MTLRILLPILHDKGRVVFVIWSKWCEMPVSFDFGQTILQIQTQSNLQIKAYTKLILHWQWQRLRNIVSSRQKRKDCIPTNFISFVESTFLNT